MRIFWLAFAVAASLAMSACGSDKAVMVNVPPSGTVGAPGEENVCQPRQTQWEGCRWP